jgi:hypothetical protein
MAAMLAQHGQFAKESLAWGAAPYPALIRGHFDPRGGWPTRIGVVGCGNATMRVQSGDWIRVDGSNGTVEVLCPA